LCFVPTSYSGKVLKGQCWIEIFTDSKTELGAFFTPSAIRGLIWVIHWCNSIQDNYTNREENITCQACILVIVAYSSLLLAPETQTYMRMHNRILMVLKGLAKKMESVSSTANPYKKELWQNNWKLLTMTDMNTWQTEIEETTKLLQTVK